MSKKKSRLLIIYPTTADYLEQKGVNQKVEFKWDIVSKVFDECLVAMPHGKAKLNLTKAKIFYLPKNNFIRLLTLPIWLAYLLISFRPTIIRVYDFVWSSLILPLAKVTKTPIVISLHGHWKNGLESTEANFIKRWLYHFMELAAIRGSTATICTSVSLCNHAHTLGARRVAHIPTWGIDSNGVGIHQSSKSKYQTYMQLLMVGRIARIKNIQLAIHALSTLIDCRIKVKLKLVGPFDDSAYLSELKSLVEELSLNRYVEFTGALPNAKVLPLYLETDCLLMTSITEGTPHPVLEALASNCPVVSSDVGDVKELVQEGKNGFLFDLADANPVRVAKLIEAAFALGSVPDEYGRQRVQDIYSAQSSANKEGQILRECSL